MKRKLLTMLLCAAMLMSVLAGYTSAAAEEAFDVRTSGLSDIFPLEEPITLSYFIRINGAMSATMETYADVEFFKRLEEMTNVKIEWNHNASDESFALMVASGELPDMINWTLGTAAGGVQALLDDEVIIPLNDLLPEHSPAYLAWMENNPDEDKAGKMDDGTYYQYINFNANWDDVDMIYFKILGPQIRQDWLDQLGLDMPTTTDELYDVLVAFKENDMNGNGDTTDEVPFVIIGGAEKSLTESLYSLAGSFGTRQDFHMDGEEIVYGPITDNYREFLRYMKKLYDEGLINSDFAVNGDAFNLVLQDRGGFAISAMGSGVIAAHDLLKAQNEEYNYVSVPWLIGPDGYQSNTLDTGASARATAITTSCEYPEIAAAWLDYAYTYAGSMSSTYGFEGESYEMIDGFPTIMDAVKVSDKGWNEEESMSRWMLGSINYPNARDDRFYQQINLNEDYKVDIQTNWMMAKEDITMPPLAFNAEENDTFSSIMADVKTYVQENSLKFIVGALDIDADWDSYVQAIEGMKIEDARQCKVSAYERFLDR